MYPSAPPSPLKEHRVAVYTPSYRLQTLINFSSSSLVHFPLFTLVSRTFTHRSLHCVGVRRGTIWATTDHLFPWLLTAFLNSWGDTGTITLISTDNHRRRSLRLNRLPSLYYAISWSLLVKVVSHCIYHVMLISCTLTPDLHHLLHHPIFPSWWSVWCCWTSDGGTGCESSHSQRVRKLQLVAIIKF